MVKFYNLIKMTPLDFENNNPIHIASANNDVHNVKLLCKSGTDIDDVNALGWTSLMQASRNGHLEVVKLLIELGANIKARNRFGMTATMLACASGNTEVVRILLDDVNSIYSEKFNTNGQFSSLIIASLFGYDSVVRLLLDRGMNANSLSPKTDLSPLMFAASRGNALIVDVLLERGAKMDVINKAQLTASDMAKAHNFYYLGQKLLINPLKSKNKGQEFKDVIQTIKLGDISILQEILFIDPTKAETETLEGVTPLMIASMLGHVNIVELLLFHRANINSQDFVNGFTPLMLSIYYKSLVANHDTLMMKQSSTKGSSPYFETYEPVSYESLDPDIPSPQMPWDHLSIFSKFDKCIKEQCNMSPPILPKLKKGIPETGSTQNMSVSFSNAKLIGKMKNIEIGNRSAELVDSHKVSPIKLNVDGISFEIKSSSYKHYERLKDSMLHITGATGTSSLSMLMSKLSLKKHVEDFKEQEIDIETFLMLNPEGLKELGINDEIQIKNIMKVIDYVRELN